VLVVVVVVHHLRTKPLELLLHLQGHHSDAALQLKRLVLLRSVQDLRGPKLYIGGIQFHVANNFLASLQVVAIALGGVWHDTAVVFEEHVMFVSNMV
jgi:hypothetical protein